MNPPQYKVPIRTFGHCRQCGRSHGYFHNPVPYERDVDRLDTIKGCSEWTPIQWAAEGMPDPYTRKCHSLRCERHGLWYAWELVVKLELWSEKSCLTECPDRHSLKVGAPGRNQKLEADAARVQAKRVGLPALSVKSKSKGLLLFSALPVYRGSGEVTREAVVASLLSLGPDDDWDWVNKPSTPAKPPKFRAVGGFQQLEPAWRAKDLAEQRWFDRHGDVRPPLGFARAVYREVKAEETGEKVDHLGVDKED